MFDGHYHLFQPLSNSKQLCFTNNSQFNYSGRLKQQLKASSPHKGPPTTDLQSSTDLLFYQVFLPGVDRLHVRSNRVLIRNQLKITNEQRTSLKLDDISTNSTHCKKYILPGGGEVAGSSRVICRVCEMVSLLSFYLHFLARGISLYKSFFC